MYLLLLMEELLLEMRHVLLGRLIELKQALCICNFSSQASVCCPIQAKDENTVKRTNILMESIVRKMSSNRLKQCNTNSPCQ